MITKQDIQRVIKMSWEDNLRKDQSGIDFGGQSTFGSRAVKRIKDATDKLTSVYLHSELVTMANNAIREFEEAVDEIVDKAN